MFLIKNIVAVLLLFVIMSQCAPAMVKLTAEEKKCVESISKKYACSVKLRHSAHLPEAETPGTRPGDSTVTLVLSWDKTQKQYRHGADLCNGDSSSLAAISQRLLAPELMASLNYKPYYRYMKVYFETHDYEYIGPAGDTLRDSRNKPMIGVSCVKSILLRINNNTYTPAGFSDESKHFSGGR